MFSTYIAWTLMNSGMSYWPRSFYYCWHRSWEACSSSGCHTAVRALRTCCGHCVHWSARHPKQPGRLVFWLRHQVFPSPFPSESFVRNAYVSTHELGAIGLLCLS